MQSPKKQCLKLFCEGENFSLSWFLILHRLLVHTTPSYYNHKMRQKRRLNEAERREFNIFYKKVLMTKY
jgi:hypothetical protein